MIPKKKKQLSLRSMIKKADKIFSLYVRLRDCAPGLQYAPCISCGKILHYKEMDAGHFIGRQHMSLRFDEKNVNAQCRYENRFNEGNKVEYAKGLQKKYGVDVLDYLAAAKRQYHKWTVWELELLITQWKIKIARLK